MTAVDSPAVRSAAANFWTYWSASAISGVGSAVTAVALPLTAISVLGATALEVSVITAASYVAWLVIGLPAGVISQRLPLRGVQVGMDLTRFAGIASIPVAWYLDVLTVAQLAVAALIVSFSTVLFDVSNSTFLPSIVPREQLAQRNSLTSATHATTELAGPSLGGVLVQTIGAVPALIADAVSYLASAVLLRSLPARQVERPDAWPRVGAMIREGWRFVIGHPIMRPSMICATTTNFVCGGLLALVPLYLVRGLQVSPLLVGLLLATEGAGSLVGASLTPWLVRRVGSGPAVRLGASASAAAALLLPLATGTAGIVLFALGNAGFAAGGRRVQHLHPHAPTDGQPAAAAVPRHGDRPLRVLGRYSCRRVGRRRHRQRARGSRVARGLLRTRGADTSRGHEQPPADRPPTRGPRPDRRRRLTGRSRDRRGAPECAHRHERSPSVVCGGPGPDRTPTQWRSGRPRA
jgi:MFS family permease